MPYYRIVVWEEQDARTIPHMEDMRIAKEAIYASINQVVLAAIEIIEDQQLGGAFVLKRKYDKQRKRWFQAIMAMLANSEDGIVVTEYPDDEGA